MTPFKLSVLIHYYSLAYDFGWPQKPSFLEEQLSDLYSADMIQRCEQEDATKSWELTERGRFYVEHLLSVPLPVRSWEIPS